MKNKLFLTLVAFATLFTACKKDNADQVSLNQETISATLHEPGTRTSLNGLQVVWSAGDAISVFASNWNEYSNNKGTLISGAGTTSADFSLIWEGTEKVAAVYPYQEDATFDGRVVSLTMPDVYDYADSDISGAPMAALFTNNSSNVTFKNAGALLVVTVNNIPAGYNKAILTATGASIAGDCQINFDNDGVPTLTAVSGEEQITINFDAANEPNKTFYFPLPVADYSELVFSISNGTDTMVLKTKALNAERNKRYQSVITLDTVTGDISSEVTGGAAATDKLQDGVNSLVVNVSDDENNEINLPNNAPSNPTSLTFNSIGNTEGVVINGGDHASEQVNIQASADNNSNNTFDINLPYSTVSLGANGEEATYQSVTALTAANTLIVEENVTVENLVVKGGNVCVYGKVNAISRHQDNADEFTYVYVEDGATIPANLDDAIIVVRNGVAEVSTADELTAVVADANISEIKFADDIAIVKNQVAITRNLTFDLNGCTISGVCNTGQDHLFMVGNGATLNVKDSSNAQEGKITFASGASTIGWTIDVCGTLNLYSGTLELTGNWSIGYVADVRPNAWGSAYTAPTTFNMHGGKVISSDAAVRVASSSSSGFTNISANFNMYDGEIDADWDGIFIQQSDAIYDILNVLVSGGTIKADKFPVRLYGPKGTSVIGGGKVATTLTISGGIFGKSTDSDTKTLIEGMLYCGGGIGNDVANLPYTKISVSGCTCGGENINFAFDSTNLE